MTRNKKIFIIIFAVAAILALWFFIRFVIGGPEDAWICGNGQWVKHGNPSAPMPTKPCDEKPVACTMDAKLCPDGSYVARIPPKCEFAPCPSEVNNDSWKTFTTDKGATFQYPENLSTKYIRLQGWPPKLQIIDGAIFSCEQGGLGINGRLGMTIQKKMNNIVYCIENVSEGTTGTFYTNYTYTFLKGSKLVKLSFALAYPECENYDDSQKTECEQERQTFDLDILINRITESVQL